MKITIKHQRLRQLVLVAAATIGVQGFAAAAPVTIDFQMKSTSSSSFTTDVVIKNNTTSAISSWNLTFKLGTTVKSFYSSTMTGSDPYTFTNVSSNGSIAVGATKSFGFTGNGTFDSSKLANCTINGQACTILVSGVPVGGSSSSAASSVAASSVAASSVAASSRASSSVAASSRASSSVAASSSSSSSTTGTTYNVTNGSTLTTALGKVVAGDTIIMASGTYSGAFVITRSGAKNKPITLQGPSGAVMTSSGYGLRLTGASYWKLTGFTVNGASKGIVLDTSHHVLIDGVTVKNIEAEAIHFRTSSHDNVLTNSTITNTGTGDARYGEAVYVGTAESNWKSIMGSDSTPDLAKNTCISKNNIGPNITAEGIDVKEGSSYTYVFGNTFDLAGVSGANSGDSGMDMKGQYIYVFGNTVKNTKPTYLAEVLDNNGAVKATKIVPDAFQSHFIDNLANAPSGTNIWVWGNTADLKSAGKPSGYAAGMMFRTDGKGSNNYCSTPGTNSVASGDSGSDLSAVSCSTAVANIVTTCPAVLTQ
ncbi:MAG: hypothetical protein JWL63_2451 [Rhodocyclales bacterium]|nr:hypothetical protein [Rhodocyclales bacterium]